MQNYEKPEVILMTECSEDVYLASGGQTGEDPTAGGCDSRYMKGAWKKPDYSNSNVRCVPMTEKAARAVRRMTVTAASCKRVMQKSPEMSISLSGNSRD